MVQTIIYMINLKIAKMYILSNASLHFPFFIKYNSRRSLLLEGNFVHLTVICIKILHQQKIKSGYDPQLPHIEIFNKR